MKSFAPFFLSLSIFASQRDDLTPDISQKSAEIYSRLGYQGQYCFYTSLTNALVYFQNMNYINVAYQNFNNLTGQLDLMNDLKDNYVKKIVKAHIINGTLKL